MKAKTRAIPIFSTPVFSILSGLLLITGLVLFSANARAELRCDCTQVIEACSASVNLDGMDVNVESSNDGCSRVDYLVDGQPYSALVVGGEAQLAWQGQPQADTQIVVENCRVCADRNAATTGAADTAAEADSEEDNSGELQSIVKVMPTYPRDAWTRSLEGDVLVEFGVNKDGKVQNIKIIQSSSPVFETNTIDAVSRFRYSPAMVDGAPAPSAGVRERFSFRMLDGRDPVVTSITP